MRLKFFGGPYDGMEIDLRDIDCASNSGLWAKGDLIDRFFIQMPESREVWEKRVRGEKAASHRGGPWYEKVFSLAGDRYVLASEEGVAHAQSEARLLAHPRAQTAFAVLSAEDKGRVLDAASALLDLPPDQWPADRVTLLDAGKRLYLLWVSPELRAFIRIMEGGQIEVNDIVREETLRLFQEKYAAGVPK